MTTALKGMSVYGDGTTASTSVTNANLLSGSQKDGGSCCAISSATFSTTLGLQPNGVSTAVTAVVSTGTTTSATSITG